jgi:hypothetical protein
MEGLYIAPGISTPEIIYDTEDKALFFLGQSFPADSVEFYKPVFEWINKYIIQEESELGLKVVFKLKYYNTSSSKQFARFFKILEDSKAGNLIKIHWFYHDYDNDMCEAGTRFGMLTNLNFEVKKYLTD